MSEPLSPFRQALAELAARLAPGFELARVRRLGDDEDASDDATVKGVGYGASLLLELRGPGGAERRLVFRTNRANAFGHDRRADRAAEALLSFDTAARIPRHPPVLDAGAIRADGSLTSLANSGEFYFVTGYAPGAVYAADLRRIGRTGQATPLDRARRDALAEYLAALHAERIDDPDGYRRAIRDLIGHGEGLFGLADSYREDAPGATLERIRRIERLAADWRWRLRGRESRLSRTHGDFHPFNLLFEDGSAEPGVLDASRGCQGDPADDAVCLTLNYLFFALEHPDARAAFGELWEGFWARYLAATGDEAILEAAPPYLAWRVLVLASPLWYPHSHAEVRRALLDLTERALEEGRLDLDAAREMLG